MTLFRTLTTALTLTLLVMGTILIAHGPASAGSKGLTVVELFTSQGCSSCPPADAFLGELARQPDILALSFHVDYWDYIGWKDPFAKAKYTQRQRGYSRAFHKSFVYTPQMVIHGMLDATGSDTVKVRSIIKKAAQRLDTPLTLKRTGDGGLQISVGQSPHPVQASVWLALYDPEHVTKVRRGENRGQTVKNFNVVRLFRKIGEWRGDGIKISVSAAELEPHAGKGCAVFLQNAEKGPILGAAAIQLLAQAESMAKPQR